MVLRLKALKSLRDSNYGRPWPRHGLKLLYWFATKYIDIEDNEILAKYDPEHGQFGFHLYENKPDVCVYSGCEPLLPENRYPYYEVGNLHQPQAGPLPAYVRKNFKPHLDDSNTDRIIIRLRHDLVIEKVYVTEHEDMATFDPSNTYCITLKLLKRIRDLSLDDFLIETGFSS